MKDLIARILCSAAQAMWRKEPTLGKYTSETAEYELNLAFHYAAELRNWFPFLDCDFDVTKPNFNRERPDIILHRRGSDLNFLVVEVKRERFREAVLADLQQIRERWFRGNLRYRYGAAAILDEDGCGFEAQVLSREQPEQESSTLSLADMSSPLQVSTRVRRSVALSDLEREIENLLYTLYGLRAEEIQIFEDASNRHGGTAEGGAR